MSTTLESIRQKLRKKLETLDIPENDEDLTEWLDSMLTSQTCSFCGEPIRKIFFSDHVIECKKEFEEKKHNEEESLRIHELERKENERLREERHIKNLELEIEKINYIKTRIFPLLKTLGKVRDRNYSPLILPKLSKSELSDLFEELRKEMRTEIMVKMLEANSE